MWSVSDAGGEVLSSIMSRLNRTFLKRTVSCTEGDFEPVVGMLARKLRQACTVKHIKCGRWYTRAEQSAEHQVIVIVIVKSEAQNHSCKLFRMKNNLSLRTNTKKKKLNIRLKFIDQRPELCDVQDKGQGTRWKTFRKTCLLTLLAAVVGDKFFN
ncbi:uncharacterized protein LOC131269783 isoform X1 [Anopheles coustani]|uniref:uncharacterized protein LOC131269783 isoform X1 n=1 Tax=Anopheles coustani TaxID=139045 RepID=UPI002658B45A|nr:uncharacterized protein LOC131269783 isoform X1 [Anopheles coustani]